MKKALLVGLVFLLGINWSFEVKACENCVHGWINDHCIPVQQGEIGYTFCFEMPASFPWPSVCVADGNFCSSIDVNGGGGGGGTGGGGGGGACATTGFCPAECFSCSGGGGRPAI